MEFFWQPADTWIVVIGVLCTSACALVGCFLLLRGMSMMGDAISHAVLPGLAIGFLIAGDRASLPMFVGAAVVGLLTALFTQWINHFGRVDRGAAMGVVFTTLFALGLVLMERATKLQNVDIDASCVLYGAIELAPYETIVIFGRLVPEAVVTLGIALLVNAVIIGTLYKEFKISSFDPALATTLGINAQLMHYLLMAMTAMTTVAAFEAVGSIVVIAMLIVPAAAAHLLTDRLGRMIGISLIFGAVSAGLGHVGAITLPQLVGFSDTRTAAMMAVAAGVLFAGVALAAPRHGVLARFVNQYRLQMRILCEDVLALLYRVEEAERVEVKSLDRVLIRHTLAAGSLRTAIAMRRLIGRGAIVRDSGAGADDRFALTDVGRSEAGALIRSHRLWESFLHQILKLPADHVHATADAMEHFTSEDTTRQLEEATERPTHDPQGRPLPPN